MDAAIPPHLTTARTLPVRTPTDFTPPYPSYVARHKPSVLRVVMVYFGVQYQGERPPVVDAALAALVERFEGHAGPGNRDRARYVDEAGYDTELAVAYWDDPERFDVWAAEHLAEWTADHRAGTGVGFFTEVLRPAIERYETLFSSLGRPEGIAVLAEHLSDEVVEHAYWGGVRDRIPLAQTDPLTPSDRGPRVVADGRRLRVEPAENLCLIRSGQDWSDCGPRERDLYVRDVEPVLRRGMEFLRDEGLPIGCYANRYVTVVGEDGTLLDRTYGMSWWRSLADLERWSESHPTHVAIFGAALRHLSAVGTEARLRLYHEITVAAAEEQSFTYLDCHPRTGMLRVTALAPAAGGAGDPG